jgi:hypothetical protein
MFTLRTLRVPAAAAAAFIAIGTVGAAPAMAGKPAPAPTGLAATVTAHQNGSYDVAATWNVVANATSYRVSLTKGGTTLASTTVTSTSWTPHVTTTPGNASLSVRGVIGKKPGRTATLTVPLPDKIAPQGSYSSDWNNNTGLATITQDSLTDNLPVSGVTRTVNWGVGSPVAWPSGTTISHTYPLDEKRYAPTVTLEDAAHNVTVVDVPAVVINDDEAPTGSFSAAPGAAWEAFTTVTVTQDGALHDNWSPADQITREVAWGDGTTSDWTTTGPATHVYKSAGHYTPVVTLTDEAHNAHPVSTSDVVVTADTTGPELKLTLPKAKHSVKAWKKLRGTATDAETGVKSVWLKAVEKRGAKWFGYNASTHTWVKAKSKAKAFAKAKPFTRVTNAQHQWTAKLAKLRKGTLIYKVRATDQVKNRSVTLTHKATLTKA